MHKNIEILKAKGLFNVNPGLKRIKKILEHIGSPHKKIDYVLVGGTNGKGTVANTVSKILEYNGYKVGLYTSPHLVRVTERIKINLEEIQLEVFDNILGSILDACKEIDTELSYFELITTVAFIYFEQEKIDIGVLEVGMGGRWDATNVVTPLISIITNVSLEHTAHLGSTVSEIAAEKAEIIKDKGVVITSAKSHAFEVISNTAKKKSAKIYEINNDFSYRVLNNLKFNYNGINWELSDVEFGIKGLQYISNAVLSIYCIEYLINYFNYKIDENKLIEVLKSSKIDARMEYINEDLPIILDGAHNIDGIEKLVESLKYIYKDKNFNFLISFLKSKNFEDSIDKIAEIASKIIVTELDEPESHKAKYIEKVLKQKISNFDIVEDPAEAFKRLVSYNEPACVTGSLYLIGYLKEKVLNEESRPRL